MDLWQIFEVVVRIYGHPIHQKRIYDVLCMRLSWGGRIERLEEMDVGTTRNPALGNCANR